MSYFEFPHTRTYDSDLGWLIRRLLELANTMDNFINFNTIKYADPISWNITTQYEANTIVIDPATGNAYISTRPVPAGVNITNEHYWTDIYNYEAQLQPIRDEIENVNTTLTAEIERLDNALTSYEAEQEHKELLYRHVAVPEMYGATGDGVTDDTAAVQAAMNSGLPVFLKSVYSVTATITYSGSLIFGNGCIKAGAALDYMLVCNAASVIVSGIELDGNNQAGLLLTASHEGTAGVRAIITGVYSHNTNNTNFPRIACRGVAARLYDKIVISNCRVENIHRTNTLPGTISSVGIYGESSGSITITDNWISTVDCSSETTDCDGIYTTSRNTTDSTTAVITNNFIKDSTGRFIKTQVKNAIVTGNTGRLVDSESNLFIKSVDFQWGGGICSRNIFDYADKASRSSFFIHSDWVVNPYRNLMISGNIFRSASEIQYVFYCSQAIHGRVTIDNNVFEGLIDYMATFAGGTTAEITINGNDFATQSSMYRLINIAGTDMDISGAYIVITNNVSHVPTVEIFRNDNCTIKNVIIRNNIGLRDKITGAKTVNISGMARAEFELDSTTATLTGFPESFGHHFYIKTLTPTVYQYYEFAHGTSGITSHS